MDIFGLGLKQAHLQALGDADRIGRVRRVLTQGAYTARAGLYPVVGDFVVVDEDERVVEILPRLTELRRRAAGGSSDEQIIAVNVDVVGVLEPLDHEPNVRRIERGITLAYAAGATPLIVLTKSDVEDDVDRAREAVRESARDARVLAVSATEGEGLDQIRDAISAGQTAVLIGASGAGKSTLVNALMGRQVMTTSEVRDFDKKGRHTTTRRQLFALPWGAMLIDTPGTRELGLVVDDDALDASFDDVAALADGCRYRDCAHESEPGCAVQRAVADGALSAARLAGYQKQRKEMRWLEERQQDTDHEERARGRRFGRMIKEMKRIKRKP